MSFKTIETQEELDKILEGRLKEERETIKKEFEGFLSPEDAAKKYAGYLSPDAEKEKYKNYLSPEDVAKKDSEIKAYKINSAKMKIANELGMSFDAVGFLQGEDEETIKKSAESLKNLIGTSYTAPLMSTESTVLNSQDGALRNTLKSLKGE